MIKDDYEVDRDLDCEHIDNDDEIARMEEEYKNRRYSNLIFVTNDNDQQNMLTELIDIFPSEEFQKKKKKDDDDVLKESIDIFPSEEFQQNNQNNIIYDHYNTYLKKFLMEKALEKMSKGFV